MLQGMEPRQFDEWMAEHSIEPWGEDWRQTAVIATTIANSVLKAISAFAGIKLDKEDFFSESDFMPGTGAGKKKRKRYLTPDEAEVIMKAMYG